MSMDYASGRSLVSSLDGLAKSIARDDRDNATVTRIEGDTVWVRIDDSANETPCSMAAVEVGAGDKVSVTVKDGRLYIDTNYTRPSVGASVATQAGDAASQEAPPGAGSSEEVAQLASSVQENAMNIGDVQKFMKRYLYKTNDEDEGGAYLHIGSGDVKIVFSPIFEPLVPSGVRELLGTDESTILINPYALGVTENPLFAAINLLYRGTIIQLTIANLSRELLSHLISNPNLINVGFGWLPEQVVHYDNGNVRMKLDTDGFLTFEVSDISKVSIVNATVVYIQKAEFTYGFTKPDEADVILGGSDDGEPVDYDPPVTFTSSDEDESQA